MNSKTNLMIGADLGMGAIKIYGSQGGLQVLSQVALGTATTATSMLGLTNKKAPLDISSSLGRFYVGEDAHDWGRPVENLDYDRLMGAPEMTALLYAGLTGYMQRYGVIEHAASLMVGLPLETMQGADAQANADAVRRWLKGEHHWTADGAEYYLSIDDAKCTSQPAAAFFDAILGADGKLIPARKVFVSAEVGVISIGFNTVELLVVRDKAPVQRFTAGSTVGVRRLLELVNKDRHYTRGELDILLRAGKLDTAVAMPLWAREVMGQIESHWGRLFRRFAGVIVVGGGSILLRDSLLSKFAGKAIIPDDPILSIARGLYKFALARRPRVSLDSETTVPSPDGVQPPLLTASAVDKPDLSRNGLLA